MENKLCYMENKSARLQQGTFMVCNLQWNKQLSFIPHLYALHGVWLSLTSILLYLSNHLHTHSQLFLGLALRILCYGDHSNMFGSWHSSTLKYVHIIHTAFARCPLTQCIRIHDTPRPFVSYYRIRSLLCLYCWLSGFLLRSSLT